MPSRSAIDWIQSAIERHRMSPKRSSRSLNDIECRQWPVSRGKIYVTIFFEEIFVRLNFLEKRSFCLSPEGGEAISGLEIYWFFSLVVLEGGG